MNNHDLALISYGYALRIADEFIESEMLEENFDISASQLRKLRREIARDIIKSYGNIDTNTEFKEEN